MSSEIKKDLFLKRIIQDMKLDEPSVHFSDNIMSKIKSETAFKAYKYKPIISTKAIYIIISLVVILICIILFLGQTPHEASQNQTIIANQLTELIQPLIKKSNSFFINFSLPPLVPIVIISGMLVLLLDRYFRKLFNK
jgi:hypothetical protein